MPGGRRGGDTKGMVSERRVAKVIRIMDEHGQPLGAKDPPPRCSTTAAVRGNSRPVR